MILFRYFSRQILQVMLAVTVVLLLVSLTSRFIQYLGQAVSGELASDVLLLLMFYRLPDFLLVILPLSLFLGIMLSYGRMYADNEMVVLLSSGISKFKLLLLASGSAILIVLVMAALSLVIAPWGVRNTEALKQSQEQLTEIDLIVAGQFQSFGSGERVTHAERTQNIAGQGRRLENVFVAVNESSAGDTQDRLRIIVAESARPEIDAATGARFMRLENVLQYDGLPGQGNFSVGQFDVQGIRLPDASEFEVILEEQTLTTAQLLGNDSLAYQAELQWRISTILLVPVITLIAVPLSRVRPRQGQFSKLIPAALLYAAYFVLLQLSRDMIDAGELSPVVGLWWVHVLFVAIGIVIYHWPFFKPSQLRRDKHAPA
ncbi:MAG: LPS export ABC transporter permease LptF [Gammaproteobacteria bacterium]